MTINTRMHLYSKNAADIVHVWQATHQFPDNSVKPRAQASTSYNAGFHFIGAKINLKRFKSKGFCQPRYEWLVPASKQGG